MDIEKDKKESAANSTKNSKKQVGKPFEKGKSGNPNGRPKVDPEVRELLKAATPAAAKLLIDTINDPTAKRDTRLDAAKTVLDRVYGKATQPIDGNIDTTVQVVFGGMEEFAE